VWKRKGGVVRELDFVDMVLALIFSLVICILDVVLGNSGILINSIELTLLIAIAGYLTSFKSD
jgi:hypothetical protein